MPIYLNSPGSGSPAGLLSRILTAVVAVVLLAFFFIIAFPVFLALLVIVLIGGMVFSWRFRKIRREMDSMVRAAAENPTPFPDSGSSTPGSSGKARPGNNPGEILEGEYEVIDRED